MAIDKSIRQYYDSGMLVKKRADGKRPGYGRWDDPGMSPGTPSGGHQPSGGGGGGWQPVSPTPAPAPVFQPPQRVATYTPAPDTRDHEEQAVGTPFENIYTAPTDFAPTTGEGGLGEGDYDEREIEFLETGDYDVFADTTIQPGPKVDVKDIMGEVTDPGSVSYDPDYKTPEEIRVLSQDPNYGQFFRPQPVVEKPKSGILKTLGNIAMALIPGLLPAKYATAYRVGKLGYDVKKGKYDTALSKIGFTGKDLDKKIKKELAGDKYWKRGDVDTTKEYTQDLTRGDERKDEQPTIQEAVTGEGLKNPYLKLEQYIAELSRNDPRRLMSAYKKAQIRIDSGEATQQELDIANIIKKYLDRMDIGAAHGGRIDKALGGRSRDI